MPAWAWPRGVGIDQHDDLIISRRAAPGQQDGLRDVGVVGWHDLPLFKLILRNAKRCRSGFGIPRFSRDEQCRLRQSVARQKACNRKTRGSEFSGKVAYGSLS